MYVTTDTYIGYTDAVNEGIWRWDDGLADVDSHIPIWAGSDPDNGVGATGNEDCSVLQTDSQMRDVNCADIHPFLCKMGKSRAVKIIFDQNILVT